MFKLWLNSSNFIIKSLFQDGSKSTTRTIIHKRHFYEQTRSGSVDFENKKRSHISEAERAKLAIKMTKHDLKWMWQRFKDATIYNFSSDTGVIPFDDCQLIKMWDFDQRNNGKLSSYDLEYKMDKTNDMNNFQVSCDADFDIGFSKCSWTVSPCGYGLFSGYLDNTLPKDGKVVRTGYAYLGSHKKREPFGMPEDGLSIFENFTHLVLRVRGDGRIYHVMFDTSIQFDITWFDRYQFPVYTWGGPYWQYIKIPFTRFFFHYKGVIQDEQYEFLPCGIKSIGFLVHNNQFSGPFRLEIDYIGFIRDFGHNDKIEYEGYYHEEAPIKSF